MKLHAIQAIHAPGRNQGVDVLRAVAILAVILFHFDGWLPYGFLGVDLFFVISGFLVGGILIKQYQKNVPVKFGAFVMMRAFKILPSYLIFLLAGTFIAILLYYQLDPVQIIPLQEFPKYLLFYKNFAFEPVHPAFDQVWSLCVEEHFYIMLPVAFIVLQRIKATPRKIMLLLLAVIATGILLKIASLYFTRSGDTTFKTHTRIDALSWGVLLAVFTAYKPQWLSRSVRRYLLLFSLVLLGLTITGDIFIENVFYHKIILNTAAPLAFACMIAGLYEVRIAPFKFMQFIAYYSYNWYLWHALFIKFIIVKLNANIYSFGIYLCISFGCAVLFTMTVEEPFLRIRKRYFSRQKAPQDKYETNLSPVNS